MTERASVSHNRESLDPSDHIGQVPSAAVGASGEVVIAVITDGLRVVQGDRYWIAQTRGAKTWVSMAFCATKEGLLLRLKDHLLKEHLLKLGHYQVKRVKAPGRLVEKSTVSRETHEATDAARTALRRGDVSGFGVAPEAWSVIMAMPEYFPKAQT